MLVDDGLDSIGCKRPRQWHLRLAQVPEQRRQELVRPVGRQDKSGCRRDDGVDGVDGHDQAAAADKQSRLRHALSGRRGLVIGARQDNFRRLWSMTEKKE